MYKSNRSDLTSTIFAIVLILLCVAVIAIGVSYTVSDSSRPETDSSAASATDTSFTSNSSEEMSSRPQSDSESSEAVSDVSADDSRPDESSSVSDIGANQSIPVMSDSAFSDIKTQYFVLYDKTHDSVLYSKNANEKAYPASVTKLLTAAVAADYCDADTPFTVGDELDFVQPNSSLAYLEKGMVLQFEALLDAMLLPSGNDAAYVMACGVGRIASGDENLSEREAVDFFVGLMNEKALLLNCTGSHFANPDGYHDDNHFTTALDMTRIASYCMDIEIIAESCSKTIGRHVLLSGQDITWRSSNQFLGSYSYATGLKTGTTSEAGACLAASAKKDDNVLVAILFKAADAWSRYSDAEELMSDGFGYVEKYTNT